MGCNQSKVVSISACQKNYGKRRFWSFSRRNKVLPLPSGNTSPKAPSPNRIVRSPSQSDVSAEIAHCMGVTSDPVINAGSANILEVDRPCSVISRPRSRAGGFAFDLVDPQKTARMMRPAPVRLTKFKSRSKSMSGDELKTHIQAKMEQARRKREMIQQQANIKLVDRELRADDVKRKADAIPQEKAERLAKREEESLFRLEMEKMEKERKAEKRRKKREAAKRAKDMRVVDEELKKLLN